MKLGGIDIRCPSCRGELERSADTLQCVGCSTEYPIICGIPDLRVFPDPYIDFEGDRAKAARIAERLHDFDFEGLIDYYYGITSVVPDEHAAKYKRGLMAGEPRARAALTMWEAESSGRASGPLLDLGCGTAPLLVAAADRYGACVGVDIALRWLMVGRKRLAQAGLDAPLICACAEALPFASGVFETVTMDSVIEHIGDQPAALTEVRRVLSSRGKLFLATPNRLSPGPDPHTGLPAGSLLPERVTAWWVERKGGIPPKRRLLSGSELAALLRKSGFEHPRVFLPDITPEQRAGFPAAIRKAIDIYQWSKSALLLRRLLRVIGPLLYAVTRPRTEPAAHGGRETTRG